MMNISLMAIISESLIKYNPEVSKEWINSYSLNILGFTPNKGQIATNDGKEAKEVIFYTRNKNLIAYITEKGISYVIYSGKNFSRIDYELIGAKIQRNKVEYYDELPGYENYYLAHYPEGILFVKSYKKVVIKDIYENIDWVFRYDEFGNFHHEFKIKKGGEVADIRIRIKNAEVEVRDKEIEMKTPIGSIIDGKLVAYENGKELELSYNYKEDEIGFIVNGYGGNGNLVIDPQLAWATYYGGSHYDYTTSVSVDKNNNIYVVGYTLSSNFPIHYPGGGTYLQEGIAGSYDAFILKFNSNGVRLWATYYGGRRNDYATSISIDKNNAVYVVGYNNSDDFPTYTPEGVYFQEKFYAGQAYYLFTRAFMIKFSSDGVRLWATDYKAEIDDYANSVFIDNNNNVYITGKTFSFGSPTHGVEKSEYIEDHDINYNVFLTKFSSNGAMLWNNSYGGNGDDFALSVSVDSENNIYIVGYTNSSNFPIRKPEKGAYIQQKKDQDYDAFIIKLDSNGTILWSTYYGGNYRDYASSISIDKNNNIYVVGYTWSTNFPVYNSEKGEYFQKEKSGNYDAFIIKFNSNGIRLWATYYGGSGDDKATSISVDNDNDIYIVGYTNSDNLPVYSPKEDLYFQGSNAGQNYNDVFILKFNDKGERLWATYYGGNYDDYASSISIDNNNNIYITGYTWSTKFPFYDPRKGAYFQKAKADNQNTSDYNAFILKLNSEGIGR